MLKWLKHRTDHKRIAGDIYGSIVASARQHTFFKLWGVPDTREGRFEMLALHVAVVMLRLGRAGHAGSFLSRAVAETFVTDIDDNMREIGIGDLAVPHKIKRAAAALFDRHRDYGAALVVVGNHHALQTVISASFSNVSAGAAVDCNALARYVARLASVLDAASDRECLAGRLPLPLTVD